MRRGDEAMEDQELNGLVHDAYQAVIPCDGASDRVLSSLLAAQAANAPAKRSPARNWWWLALPLAACLAVVAVLVQNNAAAPTSAVANKSEMAVSETVAESEEMAYEADSVAESATRMVELKDGATFELGKPLEEPPVYDVLEDAQMDGRPCKVADRAYVYFEDEDAWYELLRN